MKRWAALVLVVALAALIVSRCRPGGTIADSESDAPIAGAAVHVSWGRYLPSYGSPQFSCDGSAFALTDATGGYHVLLPLSAAANPMTVYQVRVVAPGHYDDVLRQGLSEPYESIMQELPWREATDSVDWSRSLRPLAGRGSINAELLALRASSTRRFCDQGPDLAFDAQRWRVFAQTLCGANRGGGMPSVREDVFAFLLDRPRPDLPPEAKQTFALLSNQFIGKDLTSPRTDVLPEYAIRNACSLIREQIAFPAHSTEPMNLHFRLDASRSGTRIANIPVRILWATRHVDHAAGEGRYSREWIIRRG